MRFFRSLALSLLLGWCAFAGAAETPAPAAAAGRISGVVADPTGAVIPQAAVTAIREGHAPFRTTSDAAGRFTFGGLAAGTYILEASEQGFETGHVENVRVAAGASVTVTLTLKIASDQQSVVVNADTPDTSPEKNGGAIILKGDSLAALSDDPDELSTQLQAIAGGDGETGSQLYIDGFSGGRMPPKNSIREIRINQNPYSAQYDQMGWGRIEIFTKPGTDKLHGDYWMEGNNSPWNAMNPFVKSQPPYYRYQLEGDVNGPVTKHSSYFFTLWTRHNVTNAIVNAQILDASLNPVSFTQAVSAPQTNLALSPRFDWQWGKVHTFTVRYQYSHGTNTNSGVGQFALASQGTNTSMTEQELQFTDAQAWSEKVLNEVRFAYTRNSTRSTPVSTDPSVNVSGAFNDGGSGGGTVRDTQDHYEVQDILRINHGAHDINLGGRLRAMRNSDYSTGGYNGSWTFPSLDAYRITEQALQACKDNPDSPDCLTPEEIRAAGGGASQFSQTHGTPSIAISMADAALFAEDNWKMIPSVTFSYGLRFETQTGIHDHADFAPRLGVAWSIPGGKDAKGQPKAPRAIIRGGVGLFYTRFESSGLLQVERQNGITQTAVVISNPDFFPETCTTNPEDCAAGAQTVSSPTIFTLNPDLHAPFMMMTSIGADKPIGKHVSLSVNYFYSRGVRQFVTRNVNAPLPGTYDPSDPTSGTRPLGTNENIYQYGSAGRTQRNRVNLNLNYNGKHGGAWGYMMFSKADANTGGMGSFPSNSYDLDADWGRGSWDVHRRAALGGYARLPGGFSFNPFMFYESGAPFNIVVGQDLNGDTQFNDRPAFATDMSRASVYHTKWGDLDAEPMAGQTIIPVNYGEGPGQLELNVVVNRRFNFGPALETPKENTDPSVPTVGAPPAASAAKKKKPEIERRYTLGLGLRAENVINHPNYAPPVGVLGSSLFGHSTAVSGDDTNRKISLNAFFRF